MMMTTEDSMQYDESYGAYEEGYDEGAYYQEGQEAAGGAGMESFITLIGLWLGSSCKTEALSNRWDINNYRVCQNKLPNMVKYPKREKVLALHCQVLYGKCSTLLVQTCSYCVHAVW